MGFNRTSVSPGGKLKQPLRGGDGFIANLAVTNLAAETDETLTMDEISGGSVQQGTTLTSDVVYTLPTSALIVAEWPEMDVGDCFVFEVTNAQVGAFDVVIAVGTGQTKVGANSTLSVPPQASRIFKLIKTGAATFDLY